MQWLDVTHSYECSELSQIFGTSAPFILIDLPDIDSTSVSNRQTAASIITRADVIVWVVDPQKYADSIVHDEYLKGMAEHSSVMITVLNQADRLSPDDLDRVVGSLRGILTSHNVSSDLLVTSAVTGAGIDNLRSRISLLIDAKKQCWTSWQPTCVQLARLLVKIWKSPAQNSVKHRHLIHNILLILC